MFKGVIFDFDGVVVNSHPVHLRAWKKFIESTGKVVTENELQFVLDGRRRDDIMRHFFGDLSEAEILEFGNRKDRIFRSEAANVQIIDGFLSFLDDLENAQLTVGIASSGSRSRVAFIMQQLDLVRRFRVVVTGDEVAKGKPDPALFIRAAEHMSLEPSEVTVFEDAVSGVQAARAAGMKCIGIGPSNRTLCLLEAGASHVVPDFRPMSCAKLQELLSHPEKSDA